MENKRSADLDDVISFLSGVMNAYETDSSGETPLKDRIRAAQILSQINRDKTGEAETDTFKDIIKESILLAEKEKIRRKNMENKADEKA